jgi:hypothetical protein
MSTMKQLTKLLTAPSLFAIVLASCGTMNEPIGFGSVDPLRTPGSDSNLQLADTDNFSAGQFVQAAVGNTAFFSKRPKGETHADKLLQKGTSMKVISSIDSYLKVELDSGEIGFVPSVMVEGSTGTSEAPPINSNEIQLYPPVYGAGQPLPPVAPAEQPPAGAIPTVIDPDAPSTNTAPPIAAPDQSPPDSIAPNKQEPNANSDELREMKKKAEELAPKNGESAPKPE